MIGFALILVCMVALLFGELDGATGSFTPNAFLVWLALLGISVWLTLTD